MERKTLERTLERDWNGKWSDSGSLRPPANGPEELVNFLLTLGILRQRQDGRLDAPDLYMSAFKLVRKGGVKRE
jgi:hypothetical protein